MEEELYNKLVELKVFLTRGNYIFSEVGEFEFYFFGTNSSKGCDCEKAGIVTRLREVVKSNKKEMIDYENIKES